MAEDLAESRAAAPAPARKRVARRRRGPLAGRFLAAYLALGLLGAAGVVAAAYLVTESERVASTQWSAWYPVGPESSFTQQIADHVGRRYRLPNGDQIVGVVPGPPQVQGLTVSAVAIRSPNPASANDIDVREADDAHMYVLCGLGDRCSIAEGEASPERHRLLRRQAVELALYTFKYVDDVDSVIVLLPPPKEALDSATALFLEQRHFEEELRLPLAETIGQPQAETLVEVPDLETVRIDRLTLPFLFQYEFQGLQNETAALILSPPQSE